MDTSALLHNTLSKLRGLLQFETTLWQETIVEI